MGEDEIQECLLLGIKAGVDVDLRIRGPNLPRDRRQGVSRANYLRRSLRRDGTRQSR